MTSGIWIRWSFLRQKHKRTDMEQRGLWATLFVFLVKIGKKEEIIESSSKLSQIFT